MEHNLIVVLGTTASGKTKLAVRLAYDLRAEIISADSRQVYRGMDIGTGKDLEDYIFENREIPHHLIDIVDPEYDFNVFEFQSRFYGCFEEIKSRNVKPIMVGGTGLYLSSILEGYRMVKVPENSELRKSLQEEPLEFLRQRLLEINPSVHNTTDLLDRKRIIRAIEIAEHIQRKKADAHASFPSINPLVFGIRWDRKVLRQRIARRLKDRIQAGMVDEVEKLHKSGLSWDRFHFFGLEYRYVSLFLQKRMTFQEMTQNLTIRINQFAKKQETWFRRMERHGVNICWIDGDDYNTLKKHATGRTT
jgi:tRNA dimethylallyltransferase